MMSVTDLQAITDADGVHLGWSVEATVSTPNGIRCGTHWSALPADATPAEIEADVLAQYAL